MSAEDPTDPLGLSLPLPVRQKTEVVVPDSRAEDAEVARKTAHELVATARDAISEMGDLAFHSQSARAYEVLGQLIERAVHANKALLEIERARQDLEGGSGPTTVNQTLVLTGAEALDLVKKRMREGS